MEEYLRLMEESKKRFGIAYHMADVTFPMVRDPKILMTALRHLESALTSAMSSLLSYELKFKRVPEFKDDFKSKFDIFREECSKRIGISKEQIFLIQEVKEIMDSYKESKAEYAKNNGITICSGDYKSKTVDHKKAVGLIKLSREFIGRAEEILKKSEDDFKATVMGAPNGRRV